MHPIEKKNRDTESEKLSRQIRSRLLFPDRSEEEEGNITDYLSYCGSTEFNGETVRDAVTAIQMALNAHRNVVIPYFEEPLYISRSIILNSGNRLSVHPDTRLIFTTDGIFLRNRNVLDGHFRYVEPGVHSDCDIAVSGGIWEAPNSLRIDSDRPFDGYMGSDALFLLHNVIGVRLEHLRIRRSNRMCLMIGNCQRFLVQDMEFRDVTRDGIHVEGPACDGLIRDIRGRTGDDMIALNAWDWTNSSLTFGSIHHVIVEDIDCEPGYLWSEMRLHPGNYVLPDGRTVECSLYLEDILFDERLTFNSSGSSDGWASDTLFAADQGLFLMRPINCTEKLRETMESDFGILPLPKYNDEQEDYRSPVQCYGGSVISVPLNVADASRTGVILEALSAESRYTLIPAFYDIVLDEKNTRDEESKEMLDIILNTRIYDVGVFYDFAHFPNDFVMVTGKQESYSGISQTSDIVSFYQQRENKLKAALEDLTEIIEEWKNTVAE